MNNDGVTTVLGSRYSMLVHIVEYNEFYVMFVSLLFISKL